MLVVIGSNANGFDAITNFARDNRSRSWREQNEKMAGRFIRHHHHSFRISFGMGVDFKRDSGYRDSASSRTLPKCAPYHGCHFKILSRQGAYAPWVRRDF